MTDEENDRFEGAIFETWNDTLRVREGHVVDLVKYTDTYDRVVLGKGEVLPDGTIRMQIGDEAVKQLFETNFNKFSVSESVQKKLFPEVDPFEKTVDEQRSELQGYLNNWIQARLDDGYTIEQIREHFAEENRRATYAEGEIGIHATPEENAAHRLGEVDPQSPAAVHLRQELLENPNED